MTARRPQEDSSQRLQPRDLLRQLLRDWSLRRVLQVDLLHRVLPAVEAVVGLVANSLQVLAVPLQLAAALPQQDWLVPEHPDSCLRLQVALAPQAELVQAKPTRTRVNRDR